MGLARSGGVPAARRGNGQARRHDERGEDADRRRSGSASVRPALAGVVDLARHGATFTFLGFEFRRVRNKRGKWMPLYMPRMTARTKLLGKLREVFRRHESQPVRLVIDRINPILRGWANYFRIGHATPVFSLCSVLGRAEGPAAHDARQGPRRLRLETVEQEVAVPDAGSVRRLPHSILLRSCSTSGATGHISLGAKSARERSAGNPHAAFEEAGAGDGVMVMLVRHSQGKPRETDRFTYRHRASPRPYPKSPRSP